MKTRLRYLYATQGFYYLISGVWPLVHVNSFMQVTGWKTDIWLVKTVGGLVVAIAVPLLFQAMYGRINRALQTLMILTATAFLLVDTVYYFKGIISVVYIVDAVAQLALITWGMYIWLKIHKKRRSTI